MLIRKIEVFLRRTGMPATKFGRLATRDPRFVLDLRRVELFMNIYREQPHAY